MQKQELASSAALRETMVERQIRTFDVTDAGVLAGMKATPREFFVDQNLVTLAYSDACLTVTGVSPRELTAPLISPACSRKRISAPASVCWSSRAPPAMRRR